MRSYANRNSKVKDFFNAKQNYELIKKLLQQKNRPDGIVASVEKLTTPLYNACASLQLKIPKDVKVVCFSNLETASILNPSLTTITQPAFEMGKMAASLLFKALSKSNFNLKKRKHGNSFISFYAAINHVTDCIVFLEA